MATRWLHQHEANGYPDRLDRWFTTPLWCWAPTLANWDTATRKVNDMEPLQLKLLLKRKSKLLMKERFGRQLDALKAIVSSGVE
mmetsp:Transcript_18631/g.46127  ORF Transcript_18631/g.46127 Transcript_18631/m.46127 type:complete len:84 (-) Transcript_18631:425-676(-)